MPKAKSAKTASKKTPAKTTTQKLSAKKTTTDRTPKSTTNFEINPKNLVNLLQLSIYHPNQFSENIPLTGGLKHPILFFITTSVIGSVLSLLADVAMKQNATVLFLGISSIAFSIPLVVLSLFIISGILHIIAKILSGKGAFQGTLRIVAYSSILSVFSFVPVISILTTALILYIVVVGLSRANSFSKTRGAITVITPFLLALVIMVMLGLVGIVSLFNIGRSVSIPGLV